MSRTMLFQHPDFRLCAPEQCPSRNHNLTAVGPERQSPLHVPCARCMESGAQSALSTSARAFRIETATCLIVRIIMHTCSAVCFRDCLMGVRGPGMVGPLHGSSLRQSEWVFESSAACFSLSELTGEWKLSRPSIDPKELRHLRLLIVDMLDQAAACSKIQRNLRTCRTRNGSRPARNS